MRTFSLFILAVLSCAAHAEALRIGLAGEPATLDPHRYNLRLEETLLNDLFMGLVTLDAQARVVPGAAERWRVSDNGLQWTFELRKNLVWSDGTPLNAHDFVYSFRRLVNPETAASLAYFMYPIKGAQAVASGAESPQALGVTATDDHTLVVDLHAPYPHLAERFAYPTAFPVPEHVIERVGDDWVKPENWVSNGAYTLAEWHPQRHVHLVRNAEFAPKAAIEEVFYLSVATAQGAYNRYLTGELHAIGGFPAGELERVRQQRPTELRLSPLQSMFYLVFNTGVAPFDEATVREALSIAVDPQLLTERVLKTGDLPAHRFVPPMIDAYQSDASPHHATPLAARQQRARQLLEAAGHTDLTVTLKHAAGADSKKVSLAIAGLWRAIGVRTQLHQAEIRSHYSDLRQGDFTVAHAAWVGENNPEHYLMLLHGSTGDTNYGGFRDAAVDALLDEALEQADVRARHQLLAEAEARALALHPVTPLYAISVRSLVSEQLQGWQDNARNAHPVRYLRFR